MQLQLTTQELQILADIIEARDEELRSASQGARDDDAIRVREQELKVLNSVENQVIERDLHFTSDELDLLGILVAGRQAELENRKQLHPVSDRQIQEELQVLKQIRDRLAETCAMF